MSMLANQYGSESEDEAPVTTNSNDVFNLEALPAESSSVPGKKAASEGSKVLSAPDVLDSSVMAGGAHANALTRTTDTQMNVNLPYDALSHQVQGPKPLTDFSGASLMNRAQNTVTGWVDEHAISESDFRQQQKSFNVLGYARNPAAALTDQADLQYVGSSEQALQLQGGMDADFKPSRQQTKALKRKRAEKGHLGVFNNPDEEQEEEGQPPKEKAYMGPWAEYEQEDIIPDGPDWEEQEEHFKRTKTAPIIVKGKRDVGFGEEKSVFHGELSTVRISAFLNVVLNLSLWVQGNKCAITKAAPTCLLPEKTCPSTSTPTRLVHRNAMSPNAASTHGRGIPRAFRPFSSSPRPVILSFLHPWTLASR